MNGRARIHVVIKGINSEGTRAVERTCRKCIEGDREVFGTNEMRSPCNSQGASVDGNVQAEQQSNPYLGKVWTVTA